MFIKTLSLTSTGISFLYVLFNPVVNNDKTNRKEKINKNNIDRKPTTIFLNLIIFLNIPSLLNSPGQYPGYLTPSEANTLE